LPGYDQEFLELRTMKAWGLTPRAWRGASLDDRALMLAYELFEQTRGAYRQEWREKHRKNEEKGANPYEAMKRQMGLE
jgi:hypothetical protein